MKDIQVFLRTFLGVVILLSLSFESQIQTRMKVISAATRAEQALPDLVITDTWRDEKPNTICYQVYNPGQASAPPQSITQLNIDGSIIVNDLIESEIKAGERLTRCFNSEYACSAPQDNLQVCADIANSVVEANENNNCRQELWSCDTTIPQITWGPQVSNVTQSSAEIYWETNEVASSQVDFSFHSDAFDNQVIDQTWVTKHLISLSNLSPGTVYQYRASSVDGAGNRATSPAGYFETLPLADATPPQSSGPLFSRLPGEFVHYQVEFQAQDDYVVEHTELFIDGVLVAKDYSPGKPGSPKTGFLFNLAPGALGLSHLDFFKEHSLTFNAFDLAGNIDSHKIPWQPAIEEMDGELEILHPAPGEVLYTPISHALSGSLVEIGVYAVEYGAELCPPWETTMLDCRHLSEAVERLEFYVNDELIDTSLPANSGQEIHTTTWDASGLPVGRYEIVVIAYASDGSTALRQQIFEIRTGEPQIEVQRSVTRDATTFQIQLSIENRGTLAAYLFRLEDNLVGFQAIEINTPYYHLTSEYVPDTYRSRLDIDLMEPGSLGYTLDPGETLLVSYQAIPIFRPSSHPPSFLIGSDPLELDYCVEWMLFEAQLNLPAHLTTSGETISEAARAAQSGSDYLIVTNPELLIAHNADRAQVDRLLAKLGDLAQIKSGVLGYLSGTPGVAETDETIEAWGRHMTGRDGIPEGYLRNGYLLLVGESEIIPSDRITFSHWWWDDRTVDFTDAPYADSASNLIDPELTVGRIIGNRASELLIPIQTIINVYRHTPGYEFNHSHALVMSGYSAGRNGASDSIDFRGDRWEVTEKLEDKGTLVIPFDTTDYISPTVSSQQFFSLAAEKDILFMAGHGSPHNLDDIDLGDLDLYPNPFGGVNPFVFASSCRTGRYSEGTSLAEKFLQNGTGVYLGATVNAIWPASKAAALAFFHRWDSGESVGEIVNEVKTGIGSDYVYGFPEDVWTAEFHIYGDPEYGRDITPGSAPVPITATRVAGPPPSTLQVTVPAFQISKTGENLDWAEIPGGGWVMLPGLAMVPDYTATVEIPAGYQVQTVRMQSRGGLTAASGLNLPLYEEKISSLSSNSEPPYPGDSEWWPEADFTWVTNRNPDGSSQLIITLYPFYYNNLTREARFYSQYIFELESLAVEPRLQSIRLDQAAYRPGEMPWIEVDAYNPGPGQDLLLETTIQVQGSHAVEVSLPLRKLNDVTGTASISQLADIGNLTPGSYLIEVELRSSLGALYDRHQVSFQYGLEAGEMSGFLVTPQVYQNGQPVTISFSFLNTGSLPLDGTTRIKIESLAGETIAIFEEPFSDLPINQAKGFIYQWQSDQSALGIYKVIAYVLYGSQTTPPQLADLESVGRINLPLLRRNR